MGERGGLWHRCSGPVRPLGQPIENARLSVALVVLAPGVGVSLREFSTSAAVISSCERVS